MSETLKLSPPWFGLWNKVNSCLSGTPGVTVKPLDQTVTPYVIRIQVADNGRATALASVLNPLPSPYTSIQVLNASGSPVQPVTPTSADQLSAMMDTALSGGPLYVKTVAKQTGPWAPLSVFPVFAKSVVQFYNDDLTDLYGNYNGVAAATFGDFLNRAPGNISVLPSTTNS